MAGWFEQNAPPPNALQQSIEGDPNLGIAGNRNTGVTGGMLGGYRPAPPVGSQQPSTTMGQPPTYAPGPGGADAPYVKGLANPDFMNQFMTNGQFDEQKFAAWDAQQSHLMNGGGGPNQAFGGGGVPLSTQGDPKQIALQYAQSLGPPSPENIQKTADYMKSLGFNVQANPGSDGFFINGVGVDMVSNFHGQGPSNWQWIPDAPIPGVAGGGGFQGQPGGYWMGTTTGGGQYPLASAGGPGLATPWTTPFNAPTDITEQNDPGFQARMKMGTDAIQRSAAAKGTLLTGGLLKGLDRYAQDYASNEYDKVYNRALGQYQMAYDIFNNNGNTLFNRLGYLGSIGENAAAGVGNSQIGVGNAQAQGSLNQGNIWGNAANNFGGAIQNIYNNRQFNRPQTPGDLTQVPSARSPQFGDGYDPNTGMWS